MPARRKNNPAFIPTKTPVRAHRRTVYKCKSKPKFDRRNFVKKSRKRGGGLGAAKAIGNVLFEVGKPVVENFWNQAKRRAAEHKERIKRLYYYN